VAQAWHIEAFHRSKKLPKLETLLHSDKPKRRNQTGDEQIAVFKSFMANRPKR
jgi:hypothetical protein